MTVRRVILLGCAGGGKTTLARDLGLMAGLPVLVLDEIWPQFEGNLQAFRASIALSHAAPAWVSDGNFAVATFDLRLPQADLIVWLDRPVWQCMLRAVLRTLSPAAFHKMGDLGKVMRFIWNFARVNRPRIEAARLAYGPNVPVIHLRNDHQVGQFLDEFGPAHSD